MHYLIPILAFFVVIGAWATGFLLGTVWVLGGGWP